MLYPCPGHTCRQQMTCCLRFQSMLTSSLLLFSLKGLGSQWMSQTLHRRLPLRTPMNMTLRWSLHVTCILPYARRRYLKKKHATKTRFIVLNAMPIGIIPDTQIRLSDGCSGLMLFSSQRICQTLHKTEVSSACGYELYFWCATCSLGVSARFGSTFKVDT